MIVSDKSNHSNQSNQPNKLVLYARLMRLDKPIGILLLLWPMLWGLWFAAQGFPDWHVLFIFVMGTILMRSAGCVMNDFADRNIDPHVERTKARPMAAGQVGSKEALLLAAGLSLVAFILILPLNLLTIALSVPALFLRVVSVHQTVFRHAAGISRHCIQFRYSDGIRRADEYTAFDHLDLDVGQPVLGHCV